jgi:hypothetical protein
MNLSLIKTGDPFSATSHTAVFCAGPGMPVGLAVAGLVGRLASEGAVVGGLVSLAGTVEEQEDKDSKPAAMT